MGLINDTKFAALGGAGFTGDIRLRELAWLQSLGATSNDINDAWREIAGGGTQTVDRWLINGGGVTQLTYPTVWTPTGNNWEIRINFISVNPTDLSPRFLVFAIASDNSTVNDGIFMGYLTAPDEYAIQVSTNFGQTAFNPIIQFGEETTNFQGNMVLESSGNIRWNGTNPPATSFEPITVPTYNFLYQNFSQNGEPIFTDFIDFDDDTNSRRYDFTVESETIPPVQTSFPDQNGMNAATLSGANPTPWVQRTITIPGTGAGGDDINLIKQNYYLANGGSGNQFNDIELSFWQAF